MDNRDRRIAEICCDKPGLRGRWILAEGGSDGLHVVGLDSMTCSDVTTWGAIVPSSLHCRHASQVKGQAPPGL